MNPRKRRGYFDKIGVKSPPPPALPLNENNFYQYSPVNELKQLKIIKENLTAEHYKVHLTEKIEKALNRLISLIEEKKFSFNPIVKTLKDVNKIKRTFIKDLSQLDPTTLTEEDLKASDQEGSFVSSIQYSEEQAFLTLILQVLAKTLASKLSRLNASEPSSGDEVIEGEIMRLGNLNRPLQALLSNYFDAQTTPKVMSPAVPRHKV